MTEIRNPAAGQGSSQLAELAGKYLTFRLAAEEYGLEIIKVQEIIGLLPVTHVPRVPEYVRGVINLRGRIIPTVDLRTKFGMERIADTEKTCIIVVEVGSPKGGKMNMGIIVDEVAEVLDIAADELDHPPEFGTSVNMSFILGVGIVKEGVKILLDIDRVLTTEEAKIVQSVAQQQQQMAQGKAS
jgi:purine-binding chemotaxis protein CheW